MLLVTDKVLQNQEMAARPNVTLLMKAFALERREAHFAPYPADLCRLPLLATCPVNGTVLDPFCGTGTALFTARNLVMSQILRRRS
jgi:DNA modification methylase